MNPQEKQLLKAALVYWRKKTKDMTPEAMAWLDATRERRLNLLTAIDGGMEVEELWQETAVIMIRLFHFMERRGYWPSWIPTLEKAINLCTNIELYEYARLKSQLSQLYRNKRDFEAAERLYEQVLQYARQTQNKELKVSIYRDKAESLIARNQLDQAEAMVLTAFKYAETHDDHQYAILCKTIATIYRLKGQYRDALSYYKQALTIRKSIGDLYWIATILNDMAVVYEGLGNFDVGLATLNEALSMLESTEYQNMKIKLMMNKGVNYYRLNRLEEAEESFLMIDVFALKRRGEIPDQGRTLMNIGNVKLKLGKFADAELYIRESIEVFKSIKDEVRLANSIGTLAEILVCKQQVEQAKLYFDEAIQLLEKYPENAWGQRLLADFKQQRDNC